MLNQFQLAAVAVDFVSRQPKVVTVLTFSSKQIERLKHESHMIYGSRKLNVAGVTRTGEPIQTASRAAVRGGQSLTFQATAAISLTEHPPMRREQHHVTLQKLD